MSRAQNKMKKWKTLSSEEIYRTPWLKVRRDQVLNHEGKELTYSVIELHGPSVFIVAVNPAGNICMIQNYRYTVDKTMWETPAGFSDGQNELKAAQRELQEEAGLASDDWTNLGTLYQANGIANIPFTVFLARNVRTSGTAHGQQEEGITNQQFMSLDKIEAMVKNGEFIESAHMAAIYLAKIHGLKKEAT